MRFENRTMSNEIMDAIALTGMLFNPNSKMMKEIKGKNDFKFNSGNGAEVFLNLLTERSPVKVFTYKPFNPWTSAIGYFSGESIHVNSRKLPFLTTASLTGLLCHEYAHYCGYRHGNNWPSEEKNIYSVPYFLSSNISRWL